MEKSCENCHFNQEKPNLCIPKKCTNRQYWQPDYHTLKAENQRLKDALQHIAEYWNRDRNDNAMFNACWHAIETAEEALKEVE